MFQTKIIKIFFLAMIMFFASFGDAYTAPALTSLFEITQPNGDKFKAYLRGDEYFSWWESEKGTVLFRNLESGYFEYAKISLIDEKEELVSAGIKFTSAEKYLFRGPSFSKMTKFNLGKIWSQKREDARKRLNKIIEKQNQPKKLKNNNR